MAIKYRSLVTVGNDWNKTMKPLTQADLRRLAYLANNSAYNEANKMEYQRLGRRVLKELVAQLPFDRDQYEIRWNPGGIGVSGDHTLHCETVYVSLADNINTGWFYFRSCKHLKDYTGGTNQIVHWQDLINNGIEGLVKLINQRVKLM